MRERAPKSKSNPDLKENGVLKEPKMPREVSKEVSNWLKGSLTSVICEFGFNKNF